MPPLPTVNGKSGKLRRDGSKTDRHGALPRNVEKGQERRFLAVHTDDRSCLASEGKSRRPDENICRDACGGVASTERTSSMSWLTAHYAGNCRPKAVSRGLFMARAQVIAKALQKRSPAPAQTGIEF
jgi:hypothetical protein